MMRLTLATLPVALAAMQLICLERVGAEEAAATSTGPIVEEASALADGLVIRTTATTELSADQDKTFDALAKLPYIIEPPDILLIEGVSLTPKSPHRLEKFDVVLIHVKGSLPEQPIDNNYSVDADGAINFGPTYGRVRVVGSTVDKAEREIRESLAKTISNVEVSLSLVASAGAQSITRQHLVAMDGRVDLGAYGSVYVAGMTLDKARKAIERKLAKKLEKPEVVVDVLAYNSKVAYVIEKGADGCDNVARLPVPYPLSRDCNVDSVLEQTGAHTYKLAEAQITLRRPSPNGMGEHVVFPIACDPSTGLITPETNHPLLPGDRIFITPPATHSPKPEPTRLSPSGYYAAPHPPTIPTAVTEAAASPTADPPPADLKHSGHRQVVYDIRVIEDAHNSLAEFKPLSENGFMLADASTTLGALRILEKHRLIKYLAEPHVVTTLGRAAQFSSGEAMSDKAGDRRLRNGTHVEVSAEQADEQLEVTWLVRVSRDGADLEISNITAMADGQTAIYKLGPPSTKQGKQQPIYVVLTPTLVK